MLDSLEAAMSRLEPLGGVDGLAAAALETSGADIRTDGLLFRAIEERPGDVWSDLFGDGVWHRQDPEDAVAYDTPPPFTLDVEALITALPTAWHIALERLDGHWTASVGIGIGHRHAVGDGRSAALALVRAFVGLLVAERTRQG